MTNRIYIISDTHFHHKKVIEFEKEHRPFDSIEEHDETLVQNWNSTVNPKDTVYHLGDVYFGGRDNHHILGKLNGVKHLIMGNHDCYPLGIYQKYFGKIFGACTFRGTIFTHVPIHPSQFENRFVGNIHGHLHSRKIDDPRYACVSVEQTGLKPILLQDVLDRFL